MKNALVFGSLALLLATQASATEIERWSVKVGNTYVATVKVDGIPVQPGTNGLTSKIALSEDATRRWAEKRYTNVHVEPYEPFILEDLLD